MPENFLEFIGKVNSASVVTRYPEDLLKIISPTTILAPTGSLWAPVSDDGIDRRGGSGVESIPRAQWPFQCLIVSTAAPFLIII
jgi:hypothetical protein